VWFPRLSLSCPSNWVLTLPCFPVFFSSTTAAVSRNSFCQPDTPRQVYLSTQSCAQDCFYSYTGRLVGWIPGLLGLLPFNGSSLCSHQRGASCDFPCLRWNPYPVAMTCRSPILPWNIPLFSFRDRWPFSPSRGKSMPGTRPNRIRRYCPYSLPFGAYVRLPLSPLPSSHKFTVGRNHKV